jgi:dienelactone hydrolase
MSANKSLPVRGVLAIFLLSAACAPALNLTPSDAETVLSQQALDAPDPGRRGAYEVRTLYYGSGTDKNRPEYGDSVSIRTSSVDASKLLSLGGSAREREAYWGFGPDSMPLNARVWYPDGAGPFPLVLVVHGNHDMRDFSDPGYDYLGELLASRGYILASVDENFLNGGIRQENDARGWFLLKHLELFERFNEESDNPFQGLVDMERVALIGHSRGGEAVANAAAFNRLERYPDDATMEFDFGFDIRGIVSIAPVDGQYLPTGRKVVAEDVSYLTFHGSHDGDVTSFHGLRIYDRLRFTDPGRLSFKSAIYVYRANHGQWNSVWGPNDNGPRSARILDLRGLIPTEDQQRFAELYVSAFLEVVLRDDRRYLPMFRDHRVIGQWLPETMYVTRFETSALRPLVTYEEDIDVTTGTEAGVRLRGEGLAAWREADLLLRSSNRDNTSASQENQVAFIGWNHGEGADAPGSSRTSGRWGSPARYVLELPGDLATRWDVGEDHVVTFLLAPTHDIPDPPEASGDAGDDPEEGTEDIEDKELPPVDLTLEIVDAAGLTAGVTLSDYGAVRRPLETWVMRRRDQERDRFQEHWEVILQTYSIPLSDFTAIQPDLNLSGLREIRFVFDGSPAGEVVLDQIGLSLLDPAFLSARVDGP